MASSINFERSHAATVPDPDLIDAPFAPAVDGDVYLTPKPTIPLRTLNNRILLEPLEDEYKGLIIIPKTVKKEIPIRGRVVAFGPGMLTKHGTRWTMPDLKIGDVVLFYKHSGIPFMMNGKEYLGVRDDNLIAVLED
jgi:chaperonin GroES